jgi:hypothetical protein
MAREAMTPAGRAGGWIGRFRRIGDAIPGGCRHGRTGDARDVGHPVAGGQKTTVRRQPLNDPGF